MATLIGDVKNAYLCTKTQEKIWTHSDKIFHQMGYGKKGAAMKLVKAKYGAKDSGHTWWVLLSDTLRSLGWSRSRGDSGVWL